MNGTIKPGFGLLLFAFLFSGCGSEFTSTATVQIEVPSAQGTLDYIAIVKSHLPELSADVAISHIANTQLVRVSVTDIDPQRAATRANEMIAILQKNIEKAETEIDVLIFEPAANPAQQNR